MADLAARHHKPNGAPMPEYREPRVWFEDEDIPTGVHVLTEYGRIELVGDDEEPPGEPSRMIGFGPLVEVILPDHAAAVAAEKARRRAAGGAA